MEETVIDRDTLKLEINGGFDITLVDIEDALNIAMRHIKAAYREGWVARKELEFGKQYGVEGDKP
jgi:hypothetical protein